MPRFGLQTTADGAVALITLRGELDMLATAELESELERLTHDVVAIDLRALLFLDSAGLRTILLARDRLGSQDRRLVLVRGCEAVQRVFEITRMTERLEFVDAPELL
ncbi:STAS domain-containing protein [Solirubrobacter sp. CPCC 204708]|uniref:Anti-sigma factor antagonist n=1 Tax=Solirubrobacter deserti TaxID=2282478 RepID=A0ABT4RQY8_9ACTN|nr:STAS domain-containing protein [Solirubrobacter deserti]MBE2320067.1 STAS domain-containing protein [Solirubrobacter deserti]MDA0140993.1 STAS domain-containing protein [Solirubrobacter deserti]